MGERRESLGVAAFKRSSLTLRSPPIPPCEPTSSDLGELQLTVADGEASLNLPTVAEAKSSLVKSVSDNSVMDEGELRGMVGLVMPSHIRRKVTCDKKVADGNWLNPVEEEPGVATSVVATAATGEEEALAKPVFGHG